METNPEEVAGTWSDDVVRLLAIEHSLDFRRVLSVLIRVWLTDDDYGPSYVGVIEEALSHLGPLETLKLLEQEDLEWLLFRIKSYGLLMNIRRAPVYSLAELAELAGAFVPYLESNREHLLKTGYPRTSFGPSAYFDLMLARLYYVKLPLRDPFWPREWLHHAHRPPLPEGNGPPSTRMQRLDDGSYEYDYVWAKETASLPDAKHGLYIVNEKGVLAHSSGFIWDDQSAYTDDRKPVTPCAYEDAALITGLSPADAIRAEQLRGRALECKLGVLDLLASAACAQDCSRLWPGCAHVIASNLSADDARFLLEVDQLSLELRLGCEVAYGAGFLEGNLHTGGLSDVFTLIGHFEKEVAIGTMHRTKQALAGLAPGDLPPSYCQVIGKPWQGALDQVLDQTFGLMVEETEFWKDYRARVNQLLEEELYEELTLKVRVKRRLKHPYEPFALSFLEMTKILQEDTGWLPELKDVVASEARPTAQNAFTKEGPIWVVSYEGVTRRFPDWKGMHYLAYLLANPYHEFAALDLVRAVSGLSVSHGESLGKMGDAESAGAGFTLGGGAGEDIAPGRYGEDVKAEIQRLDEAVDDAENEGNADAAAYYKQKRHEFMERTAGALGLGGRSRKFVSDHEKARNAVSHSIHRALERIRQDHPLLHSHLTNALTLGAFVSYRRDRPIDWQI